MTTGVVEQVACCSVSVKSNLCARIPVQLCRPAAFSPCGSQRDQSSPRTQVWQSTCMQRWEGKLNKELRVGKRWALQHPTHQHARATFLPAHSHTRTNMNADAEPAQPTNKPKTPKRFNQKISRISARHCTAYRYRVPALPQFADAGSSRLPLSLVQDPLGMWAVPKDRVDTRRGEELPKRDFLIPGPHDHRSGSP